MMHQSRPEQFQANVLVVPLFAGSNMEFQRPILAAREALERGTLRIVETSSVNHLIVEITDDVVVLLPEHEILQGGGQNRTPAGSFLFGRGRHEVPVYCVEKRRWNPEQGQLFHSMGFQLPLPVRRAKLKARLSDGEPQRRVWETIEGLLQQARVVSRTENVGDLYPAKERGLRVLVETFPQLKGQCGVMVFIRGHLRGIEWVASPELWRLYHKPVLAGYFIDNFSGEAKPVTWEEVSRLHEAFMEQIFSQIPVNLAQEKAPGRERSAGHPFVFQEGLFRGVGEALFYEDQPYAVSVLALDV